MSRLYLERGRFPQSYFQPSIEFIKSVQLPSGEIPWFDAGKTDPWDHVEAAMALGIGGDFDASRRAYRWMRDTQLADGSWWSEYRAGEVGGAGRRETNFAAYFVTGLWHDYLLSKDLDFLREYWPSVERAMAFVIGQQTCHGDMHWAVAADGVALEDALVTGCSSIYKSLECGVKIAAALAEPRPAWGVARRRLGDAICNKPHRFDRTWESKSRFSMDWFYPVLAGCFVGSRGKRRIEGRWHEFIEPGYGCRCVSDQPWVTVAETSELVMALLAVGERHRAVELFSWLDQWRARDGSYWTGYQLDQALLWPEEKPTWTAAAVILAADALTGYTGASGLFTSVSGGSPDGIDESRVASAL